MIITRTPFRISFFGGGTDYPVFYSEHGGAVLATTINRYCYITLRHLPQFFEYKHRVVYSKTELINEIDHIIHPSVRESLRHMQIDTGLEIHHDGDLPARTGLGSSSSFTVGLLLALHAYQGRMVSKRDLAEQAIHVEQNLIKENVGSQDQTMAAFGGLNVVRFNGPCGQHLKVTPVCQSQQRKTLLQDRLMLFFTGLVRTASEIAGEQIRCTSQKIRELKQMQNMVDEAAAMLSSNNDLDDFGRLLNETWMLKRSLTKCISNDQIDRIYALAMANGALGGKILGAGGGGFILFYVPPERQEQVKQALRLLHVPFKFENQGAQLIFYEPDDHES